MAIIRELFANFPFGIFTGLRAMTIQNYIEANVKNGLQYELASGYITLGTMASNDVIFITGSKPVIIKNRIVKFNGVKLSVRIYSDVTYTGGTEGLPIYNLNDMNPEPTTVTVITGATITDEGTEFGAPTYELGSTGLGSEQTSVYTIQGVERILRPNTVYMQRTTNLDGTDQTVVGALTWYEGDPDLPRPEEII